MPLANDLRPQHLNEMIGQSHLIGPGKIITRMVQAKAVTSMILYSKPGLGKSSLAQAIANDLNVDFLTFNASVNNKKDLEKAVKTAQASPQQKAVLLLDEIHRLTKPLQDYLLSFVENGTIILIGATTENPYINITPAINSRVEIFELHSLTNPELEQVLDKAINYYQDQNYDLTIDADAKNHLINTANGEARTLLNHLEILATTSNHHITIQDTTQVIGKKPLPLDKDGDGHYNIISALQKSIRGSDTDAALFYTAAILESDDLPILVRRLTVIAYEDIGLADPKTVQEAITAINTATNLGLPEARIPISNAIILLANAPKSNSAYKALDQASLDLNQTFDVPNHLKDAHYKGAKQLGHGLTYQYAHDYPNDWVAQQYLPDNLYDQHQTIDYYQAKNNPNEARLNKTYHNLKNGQYQNQNK